MNKDEIELLIEIVVIPALIFFLSLIMRRMLKRPLTAGADWFLLIVAFDATAILSANKLQPLIHDQFIRDIAIHIFLALLFVSFITWLLSAGIFEIKLEHAYSNNNQMKIVGWFGLSWSIAAVVTAINVLVFTWNTKPL